MTAHKHLKTLVRARMEKTAESYSTARRQVIRSTHLPPGPRATGEGERLVADPAIRCHAPGSVPASTALTILLDHAGVRLPGSDQPLSEAMVYGLAGGIGIGMFQFFYEKEGFASFYLAARHAWQDDVAYYERALKRLGITPIIRETGSTKAAGQQLIESLADGPCIAWVDAAMLPHRALPEIYQGGAYHVVTIYDIDSPAGIARLGDMTDEPVTIPLAALSKSRERIKKQKNRLLSICASTQTFDVRAAVRDALLACSRGLVESPMKNMPSNFTLDGLRVWADRLESSGTESWAHVFAPGKRMWAGLTSVHDFIEHHGTGGGLSRPLFAEFLTEAADLLRAPSLARLATTYVAVGEEWRTLAEGALPDDIPLFREAKATLAAKAELTHSGGFPVEIRAAWDRLSALSATAADHFPIPETECASLRAGLARRVRALYEHETAARTEMLEAAESIISA